MPTQKAVVCCRHAIVNAKDQLIYETPAGQRIILQDGPAGFVIRFLVAGGVGVEAIEGNICVQEDHPELDNLVLIEVKFVLKDRQLAGSPLKR